MRNIMVGAFVNACQALPLRSLHYTGVQAVQLPPAKANRVFAQGLCACAPSLDNAGLERPVRGGALRHVLMIAVAAGLITFAGPPRTFAEEAQILNFDHNQSLVGSDFSGRKDLRSAIFSKANCSRSNFKGADLENALLDDANYTEANLDEVNAVNVLATNAKFFRASLRGANFTNANLISAQFGDGADVTDADFSDALIDPAQVKKLCVRASGINPFTNKRTRETLMCDIQD